MRALIICLVTVGCATDAADPAQADLCASRGLCPVDRSHEPDMPEPSYFCEPSSIMVPLCDCANVYQQACDGGTFRLRTEFNSRGHSYEWQCDNQTCIEQYPNIVEFCGCWIPHPEESVNG